MSKHWGYHLILDCKNGRKLNEDSEEDIRVFIKELVNKILLLAGIMLKDSGLYASATQEDQKNIQQEKS